VRSHRRKLENKWFPGKKGPEAEKEQTRNLTDKVRKDTEYGNLRVP